MLLLWSLLHESGEEKSGEWPLGPVSQKPQSLGSAITYGRRYCFTAATNIVLEDDDDGQRAQQDHGSRQSAGDVWEKSTPAPPRRDQQDDRQGDTPKGDRSWAKDALQRAKAVKSDAEAAQLIRETTAAHIDGRCNREQQDQIQNTIRVTLKNLRATATPVDVEDLARRPVTAAPDPHASLPRLRPDSRARPHRLHPLRTTPLNLTSGTAARRRRPGTVQTDSDTPSTTTTGKNASSPSPASPASPTTPTNTPPPATSDEAKTT